MKAAMVKFTLHVRPETGVEIPGADAMPPPQAIRGTYSSLSNGCWKTNTETSRGRHLGLWWRDRSKVDSQ
jgi:hypothetical protein